MRQKRETGNRIIVNSCTPVPKYWQRIPLVDENKDEYYHYLPESISSLTTPGKKLYNTQDTGVVSSHWCSTEADLAPCDHEEAGTSRFLHALHCAQKDFHKTIDHIRGTDGPVLATATFYAPSVEELLIAFGIKKLCRYKSAHTLEKSLG